MKKNLISILSITLLLIFVGTACQDEGLLEPGEDNQQELERVLRDPVYAEGILISAYKDLPGDYSYSECATDDAVHNANGNNYRRMATGEWSALFNPVSEWNAYTAIFHVNFFLSVVEDVQWSWQDEERNKLFIQKNSGEAYALRGYYYLQLLMSHSGLAGDGQIFGVPLITEPLGVSDEWKIERATFDQVMTQINADFDLALSLLPYTWSNDYTDDNYIRVFGTQNKGRIQGQIVTALKAKSALLAASPAFNVGTNAGKYAIAAELTAPLLEEIGGAQGLPADGILFYNEDTDVDNPEILWRRDYFTGNNQEIMNYPPSLFGQGRVNPTQNLVDAFPMANGYPINDNMSGYHTDDPYTNRDPRLEMFILYQGATLRNSVIDVSNDSPTEDGLNKTEFSTRTGYYLKKLLRTDVNLDPAAISSRRHFYPLIRYTELFLNYAEAANEAYGTDGDPNGYGFTARDIIGAIRRRAGIHQPDNYLEGISGKDAMRRLIRNERRIELCFEGHRFWDIRRWKLDENITETAKGMSITGNVYDDNYSVESRAYILPAAYYGPIPQNEINKNELLIQNTGW